MALALLSAVLVPDYQLQPFSFVFKPFVAPLMISLPLAIATFRSPPLLSLGSAACLCAVLLVAYTAISMLVYWLRAGDALFDGMSIPIIEATLAVNAGVSVLSFIATWAVLRYRSRHAG